MSPHDAGVVVVRMHAPVSPDQAQRLYARLDAHFEERDPVCVLCRVQGPADLSVLDVLARIALIAGRRHASVRATSDCGDLQGLLWLTGLTSVITVESESGRQSEALEESRVEEVVDVDDLAV